MTSSSDQEERLLDLIYDAATEQELWSSVLTEIADITGSLGGMVIGVEIKAQVVPFTFNARMLEESHATYRERHIHNPWSGHMVHVPVGKIVQSDEILPLSELKKTAFFNEVLRPQDMAHNEMLTLARRGDFFAAFNICRSERQGHLDAGGLDLIKRIYPHLRRSLLLNFRLDAYRNLQRAEYDVLDRLANGVVLLDRRRKIIYANATARDQHSPDGPLTVSASMLSARTMPYAARLEHLVARALGGTPAAAMSLPRTDGRLLTILVSAVRSRDVERFHALGMRGAAVLLYIIDPANRRSIPIDWVIDAFGLTQAEARVAIAVSAGSTIPETAAQLGLSPNTVKTHLRHVFAKTGTGRQAELAILMASFEFVKGK